MLQNNSAKLSSNKSVFKEKRNIFEYFESKGDKLEGRNEVQFLSDNKSVKTNDLRGKSDFLSQSIVLNTVRTEKTKVAETVVGLPNLTKRKPQSEKKLKRLSTSKKRKSVKEMRNELELKTLTQITHFFKKENKIEQKDYNGERTSTPKKF